MKTILVLDSGFGGLYAFKRLCEKLKDLNIRLVYLCDNDNCPYGAKNREEIYQCVKHFVKKACNKYKDISMLVLACNTASAVCLDRFKTEFSFKIFGLDPISRSLKNLRKSTLILATTATTSYNKNISDLTNKKNIKILGLKNLAKTIENHYLYPKVVKAELIKSIKYDYLKNTQVLVLGCSHYKIIKKQFKEVFYNKIHIIDRENYVINSTIKYYKTHLTNHESTGGNITQFVFSNKSKSYQKRFFDYYNNLTIPHKMSL